ncbi:MAG: RnfABCDGE type electron transport complex subunit D [Spirochaetota bacterium]
MKIQKQQMMRTVLKGLLPLGIAAIYFFGWRFLAVLAAVTAAGVIGEYLMARRYSFKVTESLFVSCFLFALSMPPSIPLWMAVVGILFGIVLGKMVFGGFGRNIFNPAISGRAFVYVSFGVPMTAEFISPAASTGGLFPGGFGTWLTQADTVSSATPLVTGDAELLQLFLGFVPGSFGETSALLVLLGGVYIIWKKAANWRLTVSSALTFVILYAVFWVAGIPGAHDPLYALLSGSFLLAAFFMITDPVSSSQSTNLGRWLYGGLFGVVTVLIRVFANWPEAVTFAILFANMFAPLIDHMVRQRNKKKKAAAAAREEKA